MRMKGKMTAVLLIAMFMISTLAIVMSVSAGPPPYSYSTTVGTQPVSIVVTETKTAVTWIIDFPGTAPYDEPTTEGDGSRCVGLIIALDGDGDGPAFQIHNNDGTDSSFDWGTWLVSPWGPTISDGWNGWHSGDTNTEVSTLSWVSCTGGRYNSENPDGLYNITINKTKLARTFQYALNLAIGSGFYGDYLTYEQMACPEGIPYFDWANPLVDMEEPNYIGAQIVIPRPIPRIHGGPIYFDGVNSALLYNTPHKLIAVDLKNAPHDDGYYPVIITILAENGTLAYTRTFYVRPLARTLALYLHESVFPDNYSVVVTCETGNLPYLVASRAGIERSG